LIENENVFDPLNAQIQIRKNVIAGLMEFSLMLPDLKTGSIEANNYKLLKMEILRLRVSIILAS